MVIAGLLHVNWVEDDEFKALNAEKISKLCLFLIFILSKKMN